MKPEVLQLSPILIPQIRQRLETLFTVHRYYEQSNKEAWLDAHAASIRGVITGGHTGISQALMARLPNLEIITVNGVGTDAIDLAYARDRGIPVCATIGALTEDVADLAIGLLIGVCRGICTGDRFVRAGHWATSPTPLAPLPLARQVSGMRVGIVGMGRVGRAVAQRAAAFGCPIVYTDLQAQDVPYNFEADLVQLAKNSDALILAAAADKGEALVTREILQALGRDGYLINIARGKLVDEPALLAALQAGEIAGAALDVFADEPRAPEALFEREDVVLQPHRASATVQTRTRMGEMVVASLVDVFAGRKPQGLVL
ncbi:2-hydroxyacid dehydrogenase [Pseudomonas xanthosomatis]|uniref:2-hydroxyacid dehydrogenase n=1 Tax=Pseudomonas xanthosomatis TaxID=2842356 RepID=UPI001C3DF54E|nr:2-hydroxyacid dehydrogenase [Pseudomonas xanthosomatis]QXH48220.1 2-hydroxyacid dehydrogenase [Pseudomonas xanthosomatis]